MINSLCYLGVMIAMFTVTTGVSYQHTGSIMWSLGYHTSFMSKTLTLTLFLEFFVLTVYLELKHVFLFISDSCSNVTCEFGGKCDNGKCVCVDDCEDTGEPVCASDGEVYQNECQMKALACQQVLWLR